MHYSTDLAVYSSNLHLKNVLGYKFSLQVTLKLVSGYHYMLN